jgi:hypothetical protein
MNSGGEDGKGAALGHVKNTLRTIESSGRLYRSLVEHDVFKLGYKTQRTHCHRSSWYNLSFLAEQLVCPLCHKKLDAIRAVDRDNKGDWWLKTAGPFSVGNHGDGSYCVLLGLEFFKRDHSLQTTPVLSFIAKHVTSVKRSKLISGSCGKIRPSAKRRMVSCLRSVRATTNFRKETLIEWNPLRRTFRERSWLSVHFGRLSHRTRYIT